LGVLHAALKGALCSRTKVLAPLDAYSSIYRGYNVLNLVIYTAMRCGYLLHTACQRKGDSKKSTAKAVYITPVNKVHVPPNKRPRTGERVDE
jgi:hypothetical protein